MSTAAHTAAHTAALLLHCCYVHCCSPLSVAIHDAVNLDRAPIVACQIGQATWAA